MGKNARTTELKNLPAAGRQLCDTRFSPEEFQSRKTQSNGERSRFAFEAKESNLSGGERDKLESSGRKQWGPRNGLLFPLLDRAKELSEGSID
jgi:hypothetical protein